MPIEFKPKQEPPKTPEPPAFNIYRIREGDVIMTRTAFETMLNAIETLPFQPRELQLEQSQNVIRVLRAAVGD